MLSGFTISHGSVATPLRCGRICNDVFIANFLLSVNSERILKIGHYLAKLWTRVWCVVFYGPRCRYTKYVLIYDNVYDMLLEFSSLKCPGFLYCGWSNLCIWTD